MYQIYADDAMIYDSTSDDYKIAKGAGTLEVNKSGSLTFALYSDHPFYDRIIKNRTVIKVKKSGRILFRGRAISSNETMKKQKTFVCEGERGFFQDSIVRPYSFTGTPANLFSQLVSGHNQQVDDFKQFKVGSVTVYDPNDYILRENSGYESTLSNLNSRLPETTLGGYIHITHGEDGTEEIPTVHYLTDFQKISGQNIEFGYNLKDFVKKSNATPVATAIIPLGARVDGTSEERLTIKSANGGIDYIYNQTAVDTYGWIFKTVIFDDVTDPANLLTKGKSTLADSIKEHITVELKAVDMHLLNRSIDSFRCGEYVRCISTPHNFAETLLCTKYSFDMLKPQNDAVLLGGTVAAFTGYLRKANVNAENARNVAYTAVGTAETAIAGAAAAASDAADAKASASAAQSSASAAASDVAAAKQTAKEISEKTAAYRIAEQEMTSLLAKSFGVFKTEELQADGSTIHYIHDKPLLADSSNIWKMTGDVFAVSSDGGNTWSAGLDTAGNAVMNVLSVVGIEASWINADNLSAISANVGGWQISGRALFCELIESSKGYIYRVWIRPPDGAVSSSDWATQNCIEIQRSTDNGTTFVSLVKMSGSNLRIQDPGGSYGSMTWSGFTAGNMTRGYTTVMTEGVEMWIGANRRAYMRDFDGTTQVFADQVRSGDGYSGTITLGGIAHVFNGGILVDAYYG